MKIFDQRLLLAAGLSEALGSPVASRAAQTTKNLIVFGDSYSTVGFWPGGQLPSASNPIGNPGLPGQTTSAGFNWVGHVTSTLNTSLILTYDFAYSGATVDKKIVNSWAQYSMSEQVDLYKQYAAPKITKVDTLVAFWIGINDVGEAFWSKKSALVTECVNRYFELLQVLVNDGYSKFVLLSIPDQFPKMIGQPEVDLARLRSDIISYNNAVKAKAASFTSSHPNVKIQIFDTKPSFDQVVNNYAAYGAKDATCFGASNCLWADDYHASGAIHKLLAQNLVKAVKGVFVF
ncbi:cellulose-binding GDSL lipase acylhydrolase [Fusarium sp. NRRL 25303]|nr:cellulose-binding GDSL lipase acylhydrolase [Fusarium sp. NRRL 25303]